MAYYVGDVPAEDLVIEPLRQGESIDLTPFTEAGAVLRDFDGLPVDEVEFYAYLDDGEVIVEWPDVTPFATAGLYSLTVTVFNDSTHVSERLAPVYFIAQEDDGWHTIDSARAEWVGAPDDDYRLYTLLQLAKAEILAYGTTYPAGMAQRIAFMTAQVMQARNTWNAGHVDPATGGEGEESFVLKPFPLDWQITQILRPKRAVPRIG